MLKGILTRCSTTFKLVGVTILTLLLLIPLGMIHALLRERLARRNEAVANITSSWGREQNITGPVLIVPYRYTFKSWKEQPDEHGKLAKVAVMETAVANAYFLPAELTIRGSVQPSQLKRGIYRAVVYAGNLEVTGEFARPNFADLRISNEDVLWDEAVVTFAIPDLRGVKETLHFRWGERQIPLSPGCKLKGFTSGLFARVNLEPGADAAIPLGLNLTLNGASAINFAPVGAQNHVTLTSTWADPSFCGAFLPVEREITPGGFRANWQVAHYGRDYAQQWTDLDDKLGLTAHSVASSWFGVGFLSGIDSYRNVERAIKYGILFVVLVFATFFLFEVLAGLRLHPFQYALVGAALSLFYLGLLSLSEFLAFGTAYATAAVTTAALIWFYTLKVLQSGRRSAWIVALLLGIYGFLYVTLQLQDYSLLFGTAGLFLVLGALIVVTRNIDWYSRDGGNAVKS
jgi:inner membrane protein